MTLPPSQNPDRSQLYQVIASHAANALSIGIQLVMISWLAADVLHLAPLHIALVQAAALIPNLLLLPFAGVLSDRFHPARLLSISNLFMAAVHLGALLLLWFDQLQFISLVAYGFALGVCNSFIQSARETLIASLSVDQLHNRISLAGVAQHCAQALGIVLAGLADWLTWEFLTLLQVILCLCAGISYAGLARRIGIGFTSVALRRSLLEGFELVWQTLAVRHTVLIVAFNGMMHMGMLMVLLPVVARDNMQFQSFQFSLLQLSFTLGGIIVQWVILRRKPPKYPGQAVLFCLLYAGVLAIALSYGTTLYGLFMMMFLWGCVSGASANLGRQVVLTVIPPSHRGRAMAIYQLALFGSAPFGALLAGWVLTHYDWSTAFRVIAYTSATVFFLSFLTRALWQVTLDKSIP